MEKMHDQRDVFQSILVACAQKHGCKESRNENDTEAV